VRTWVVAAALPMLGLACSSGSSGAPTDGARDAVSAAPSNDGDPDGSDGAGSDGAPGPSGPYDPNGPYAACNDPESQTATLQGVGFEAWEGLPLLGCLNPSQPVDDTRCDDATVTDGAFTVSVSVCTGASWDFHIFDAVRGLDCNSTHAPIDGVFTVTPADCACSSPTRLPATGCSADLDGGADGGAG
jgi:hypothetical protein